ncbi:PAS domain-containing protein [Leptolyngbya sp. 7M]|nr:PAS domain-containing protein [Leptolyngbya sp. 7M]
MADASPVMVWVTDRHAAVTYANPPMRELMGPPAAEGSSLHWLDLVHPDDAEAAQASVQLASIEQRPFTIECRFVPSASGPRWVRVSARPRFDAAGTFQGYIGVCDDIHEARLADQILRESEEKFRSMFESAPVAIALCDVAGTLLQANPRFVQLVARPRHSLAGTPLSELVTDATARDFIELARDSLLHRRLEPTESRLARPDHTSTPVLISGATVRTADGQTRLWVFAEDISARLTTATKVGMAKSMKSGSIPIAGCLTNSSMPASTTPTATNMTILITPV